MTLAAGLLSLAPFRLRRHADYQRVYAASRKYHSANVAYFFRLRNWDERILHGAGPAPVAIVGPRIGLTVPRALGNAVMRNRLKRRMREAIRMHMDLLHRSQAPGVDLVLHPRKTVAELAMPVLALEVAKLLDHVARMAPHPQPAPPPRPARKAGRK